MIHTLLLNIHSLLTMHTITQYDSLVVFFSVFFFGEVATISTLTLAQQHILDIREVLFYATCATVCADLFWFLTARYAPMRYIPSFLKQKICTPFTEFFTRLTKGHIFLPIIFLKFFIGFRLAIIVFIAHQHISLKKFLIYDIFGTIIYLSILATLCILFGTFMETFVHTHHLGISIFASMILLMFFSFLSRTMHRKMKSTIETTL